MKHDLIIARYGELALKSDGVRRRFENRLINNIKAVFINIIFSIINIYI